MIDLYVRYLLQHSDLCILPIQLTYASFDSLNKEEVGLCANICISIAATIMGYIIY